MDDLSGVPTNLDAPQQLGGRLLENKTRIDALDASARLFLEELQSRIDAALSALNLEHIRSIIAERGLVDPEDLLPCSDFQLD